MSERLIIRLGSQSQDEISWLVWSDSEQEIIASGTLNDASELTTLEQWANKLTAQVLVPACDIGYFDVNLPKTNRRQAIKAIPFMLEDDLASEIDNLHFVYAKSAEDQQGVFVVNKDKLTQWLSWLEQAGIRVKKMIPDWLALPSSAVDNGISLLQLNNDIMIRQGQFSGQTIATSWLSGSLELLAQQYEDLVIENYGISDELKEINLKNTDFSWQDQNLLLPMQQLAVGFAKTTVNLLVDEFAVKDQQQVGGWKVWRNVAIAAVISLILIFVDKGYQIQQLESQQAALKLSSETIYRKLNPNVKRVVKLKTQMKNQLKQLKGGNNDSQLLSMLSQLNNAFAKVPQLKPTSIKYDNKRREIRVQANGDNYQQFDQFKKQMAGKFSVTTGAMNNSGDKVNGSFTIKAIS